LVITHTKLAKHAMPRRMFRGEEAWNPTMILVIPATKFNTARKFLITPPPGSCP